MNKKIIFPLVFLQVVCNGLVVASAADNPSETGAQDAEKKAAYALSPVTIIDKQDGEIVVDKSTLDLQPNATLSVTEALRAESNVQFDSMALDTFTGGAITPPRISIRGAHHYENNFMINGVSNNSVLNPEGFDEGEAFGGFLPSGDSQAMFISTELLDSVTAHTENVSASYGGFLGGVVDAKYRDAATDGWHLSLETRHTRDAWLEQHYVEGNEPSDYPASQYAEHTRFKKTSFSLVADGPVFANSGLVLGYTRNWSEIPSYMFFQEDQPTQVTDRRTNENYFIRFNSKYNNDFSLAVTGTYAPYTAEMHPMFQRGGEYELRGGGYGANVETRWTMPLGLWENIVAFNNTEVSKMSNSNVMYQWISHPGGSPSVYANWTNRRYANEGMMGDWESRQKVYELKSHLRLREMNTAKTRHQWFTGLDLKHLEAEAKTGGWTSYSRATADPAVVGSIADGVITGEQFTGSKMTVPADSRSQDYDTAAFFLEDNIQFNRLLVRPGLRLSWDSITENFDFAPRIFANYEILDEKRLNLYGGYNRYYGSQILEKAIGLPFKSRRYSRSVVGGVLQDWGPPRVFESDPDLLGDLDTPYVNEYNAGMSAIFFDTFFDVTYVVRGYRDQIQRGEDAAGNTTYSNNGETDYWGVTLNVKKELDLGRFGQHRMHFAVTRSSSESNYANWADSFDEDDSDKYVELNGEIVEKKDLPVGNYAAPWVVTYTHEMRFWNERIRLFPTLRYESGGETLARLRNPSFVIGPDGNRASRYRIEDRHDTFNVDLAASVELFNYRRNKLSLEMDVTNLFDTKNKIDVNPDNPTYARGRQFYMGLKYTF